MYSVKMKLLPLAIASAILAGCGDATTNIVEKEPIVIKDPHPPVAAVGKGRLLVSDKSSAVVSVYDLDRSELIEQFQLINTPDAVYPSPGQRYAFVVQRPNDRIQLVDGGQWQEDHGDHLHPYSEKPKLMSFQLNGSRPTHVQSNASTTAVFMDGDAASKTPAAVVTLTEANISADKKDLPLLQYDTHMHGAAQPRGDQLISTIRDAASSDILPDKVGVYSQTAGKFSLSQTFAPTCPRLHGSAQNKGFVGFGCTDGVLVITQSGSTYTASKIANPADITGTSRIGTVEGHDDAAHFVGLAGALVFAVDPQNKTINKIDWQAPANAAIVGYGFTAKAKHFVLLDNQGYLTVLNYSGSAFTLAGKVQVATGLSAMPAGSSLQLTLAGSEYRAYVSNPVNKAVVAVDLAKLQVTSTLQLNYTPHKLTWLGIAN
ncbi:YncE family protein [Rheinheimera tilapiae]|uniref:YncE family protein n=1 Tax=Rheinheimera tilapiae TaxID=875043 RepID=A0ABV6BES2_9GAMM